MTGVILVAKPNKLFQVSHLRTESNKNLTKYFTGLCLALIAAFCGALIGITTKVLKGKQNHSHEICTIVSNKTISAHKLKIF